MAKQQHPAPDQVHYQSNPVAIVDKKRNTVENVFAGKVYRYVINRKQICKFSAKIVKSRQKKGNPKAPFLF